MKRPVGILVVTAFLWSVAACATPPTPTPTPLELVTTFQTAWNQQDNAGVLSLFADEPAWDWGYKLTGRQAIGNFVAYSTQLKGQWEFDDCQLADGTVTCAASYRDDCFPAELTGLQSQLTFEFTDGKIVRVAGVINHHQAAVLAKNYVRVQAWASANQPKDYAEFADSGEWRKLTGAGGQAADQISALNFGQAMDRMCTGFENTQP